MGEKSSNPIQETFLSPRPAFLFSGNPADSKLQGIHLDSFVTLAASSFKADKPSSALCLGGATLFKTKR